jgi:two-component system response regulator YesN
MYRLLIVDDEEIIRNGLKNNFRWADLGFEEPCLAENGKQALESIAAQRPHVVLTDIRMPVMDGLELLKAIQQHYQGIRTVILSGYNDFDYARSGMGYGARAYILKPTSSQEIVELFTALRDEIAAQDKEMATLSELVDNRNRYLRIERNAFLRDLLESRLKDPAAVQEGIETYGLALEVSRVRCLVFRLNPLSAAVADDAARIQDAVRIALEAGPDSRDWMLEFCQFDSTQFAAILTGNSLVHQRAVKSYLEDLKSRFGSHCEFDFVCGVSEAHVLSEIGKAYSEASQGIRAGFYKGRNTFNLAYDVLMKSASSDLQQKLDQLGLELAESVFRNDATHIRNLMMNYFSEIRSQAPEVEWVLERCLRLALFVKRFLREKEGTGEDPIVEFSEKDLGARFVIDDLRRRMEDHFLQLAQAPSRLNEKDVFVRKIHDYIKENFNKKVKLEDAAAVVFMNPSYFSVLFKEKTGVNFSDYLNEFRIERSKKLLESYDYKITDIAGLVGFYDTAHFCKAFRKITGVTPLNYRRRIVVD